MVNLFFKNLIMYIQGSNVNPVQQRMDIGLHEIMWKAKSCEPSLLSKKWEDSTREWERNQAILQQVWKKSYGSVLKCLIGMELNRLTGSSENFMAMPTEGLPEKTRSETDSPEFLFEDWHCQVSVVSADDQALQELYATLFLACREYYYPLP